MALGPAEVGLGVVVGGGPVVTAPAGTIRIFISYRRSDTRYVAGRLRDQTIARFGASSVFVDVDSIQPGEDYVAAVDRAVSRCDYLLVLIGEDWLTPDSGGTRRIDDPNDLLRLEIEAGLRHATRVIPVLVDNALMPRSEELPSSLAQLERHQAVHVRYDSFSGDVRDLLDALDPQAAPPLPTSPQPPPRRPRPTPVTRVEITGRWLSVAVLVIALLLVLGELSSTKDVVADSRSISSAAGAVVWLLPGVPVVLAAILMLGSGHRGTAVGLLLGALLWVWTTLSFVLGNYGSAAPHVLLGVLLVVAGVAIVVASRSLRAPVTANAASPALAALVLLVAAVAFRALSKLAGALAFGNPAPPDLFASDGFLPGVLIPVILAGPAVLLRLNREQTMVLLTAAWLQVIYPLVLRPLTLPRAIDNSTVGPFTIDAVVFLLGSLCIVLAVRAGERSALRAGGRPSEAR